MDLSIKICDGILEREREIEVTCEGLEEGKKEGEESRDILFFEWRKWKFSLRYLIAEIIYWG